MAQVVNQYGYRPHGFVTFDGAKVTISAYTWWTVKANLDANAPGAVWFAGGMN